MGTGASSRLQRASLTAAIAFFAGSALTVAGPLRAAGATTLTMQPHRTAAGAIAGAAALLGQAEPAQRLWLVSGAGEAGEGGEGPGFDPAAAKTDPVVYLTALEMAAAHYHAGRAAYAAGRHEEGTEMFAHGISEVYVDLRPALAAQGVADFQPLMDKAVELASAKAAVAEVDAAAARVLAALDDAATHLPATQLQPAQLRRQVLAEIMNRAAHNYMIAARGVSRDAYLDGYGYRVAAELRAPAVIADVAGSAPNSAARISEAVAALARGFTSIEHPATGDVPPGDLLVAVSRAVLAFGSS